MPFDTKSEVTTLTLDKGWVTEASVEDVKLLPGMRRTMFRLQGGKWVAREAVRAVKEGHAELILLRAPRGVSDKRAKSGVIVEVPLLTDHRGRPLTVAEILRRRC